MRSGLLSVAALATLAAHISAQGLAESTAPVSTTAAPQCSSWFEYAPSSKYAFSQGALYSKGANSTLYTNYQPSSLAAPFTAINSCSGKVNWEFTNIAHFAVSADDGTVYAVDTFNPMRNNSLFAATASGKTWTQELPGGIDNFGVYLPPAILYKQGVVMLYTNLIDSTVLTNLTATPALYAFNSKTGAMMWNLTGNNSLYSQSCLEKPDTLRLVDPYIPNHVDYSRALFAYATCGTTVFAIASNGTELFQYDYSQNSTSMMPTLQGPTGIMTAGMLDAPIDFYANSTNITNSSKLLFISPDLTANLWVGVWNNNTNNLTTDVFRLNGYNGTVDAVMTASLPGDNATYYVNASIASVQFASSLVGTELYPTQIVSSETVLSTDSSNQSFFYLLVLISQQYANNTNYTVSWLEAREYQNASSRIWASSVVVTGVSQIPYTSNGLVYWPVQNMTLDGTLGASQVLLLSGLKGAYLQYFPSTTFTFASAFKQAQEQLTCTVFGADVYGTAFVNCGQANIAAITLNNAQWRSVNVAMDNWSSSNGTGINYNQGMGAISGSNGADVTYTPATSTPVYATAVPTSATTTVSPIAKKTVSVNGNSGSSSGLSGGAIAGIVIGVVFGVLLIAAICFYTRRAVVVKQGVPAEPIAVV